MKVRIRHGILLLLVSIVTVTVIATSAEAASYNRWSAFDYALQWYNKYNQGYFYWGKLDCTNFLSQCLLAGGWPEVGKYNWASTYAWYYDAPYSIYYSNTWAVADELRKFIVNSGRGQAVSLAHHPWSSYFQVGDVIQIDYEKDNKWDHTMIVTRVQSDDIWVTYHDGDEAGNQFYESLKDVMGRNPNSKFMGYHLYDSFQAAPQLSKQIMRKAETWGNIKKK